MRLIEFLNSSAKWKKEKPGIYAFDNNGVKFVSRFEVAKMPASYAKRWNP